MGEVVAELARTRALLTALPDPGADAGDDAARIDAVRLLEEIKAAAAAAQARISAAFVASQRAAQTAAGVPAERVGRGITAQLALARRCSPHQAQRYAGWAVILTRELPATLAALAAGQVSEWRAMLVARETAWLSREHRAQLDRDLAPRLPGMGDRGVEAAVKKAAYTLDPHGYVNRIRAAAGQRRVTVRPAPDQLVRLTALLPLAQGIACHARLTRDADTTRAAGDPRTKGQVMADLLVERLTGHTRADAVPVEIQLVMTDQTLLAAGPGADTPAHLPGWGPLPAATARDLIHRTGSGQATAAPRWLRRLYTHPATGDLIAVESRRRRFTEAQRRFIAVRDDTCRTPWCDAPIRHTDHANPHHQGGDTNLDNGQGLCQACNHTKQAPHWTAHPHPDGTITTRTPTGHTYDSPPPDHLPGAPSSRPRGQHPHYVVDIFFAHARPRAA